MECSWLWGVVVSSGSKDPGIMGPGYPKQGPVCSPGVRGMECILKRPLPGINMLSQHSEPRQP